MTQIAKIIPVEFSWRANKSMYPSAKLISPVQICIYFKMHPFSGLRSENVFKQKMTLHSCEDIQKIKHLCLVLGCVVDTLGRLWIDCHVKLIETCSFIFIVKFQ